MFAQVLSYRPADHGKHLVTVQGSTATTGLLGQLASSAFASPTPTPRPWISQGQGPLGDLDSLFQSSPLCTPSFQSALSACYCTESRAHSFDIETKNLAIKVRERVLSLNKHSLRKIYWFPWNQHTLSNLQIIPLQGILSWYPPKGSHFFLLVTLTAFHFGILFYTSPRLWHMILKIK